MHRDDPLEIKLLVIPRGLQLYVPMDIRKLVVETDCLVAIQAIEEGPEVHAGYRYLIQEIINLTHLFKSRKLSYVSRLTNQVAHSLACYAWNVDTTTVWWTSFPDSIQSSLWLDENCKH